MVNAGIFNDPSPEINYVLLNALSESSQYDVQMKKVSTYSYILIKTGLTEVLIIKGIMHFKRARICFIFCVCSEIQVQLMNMSLPKATVYHRYKSSLYFFFLITNII